MLTLKLIFKMIIMFLAIYIIVYASLEDRLSKTMKERSYLSLKHISDRLISVAFIFGSIIGISKIVKILVLLSTSQTPSSSDITGLILFSFILGITLYKRKFAWYCLITNKQTFTADWYIRQYFSLKKLNKDNAFKANEYLEKASQYKPDSVFIWSIMATLNDMYLDNSTLADEYLVKAQSTLDSIPNPTEYDRALLQSAKGDILLGRNDIENGLGHLKNAANLDPINFKPKYEHALKWSME